MVASSGLWLFIYVCFIQGSSLAHLSLHYIANNFRWATSYNAIDIRHPKKQRET